jgi:hypothetical protein
MLDTTFDDADAQHTIDDLEHAVVRCYRRITRYFQYLL